LPKVEPKYIVDASFEATEIITWDNFTKAFSKTAELNQITQKGSLDDGANICQWEYWGGDGQKFILEPAAMEKAPEKVIGDVNADGSFNVVDLVMMQKFLLGAGTLTDWEAGDLCQDECIDVYDMVMMRKFIVSSN